MTDCWPHIAGLKNKTLHTLDRGRPFVVVDAGDKKLVIRVSTGRLRSIRRSEIESAFQELQTLGELSARDIAGRHARWNLSFVSTLLAALPGVDHRLRPIRLYLKHGARP
jgi:hypothetical protein